MAVGYVLQRSYRAWTSASCFQFCLSRILDNSPSQCFLTLLMVQKRKLSELRAKQQPPFKRTVKLVHSKVSDYPYVISKEIETLITAGDSQAKIKLQGLLLLLAFMRERGERLPEILDTQQFIEMTECTSESEVHQLIEMYNVHGRKDTLSAKIKKDKKLHRHYETPSKDSYLSYKSYFNSLFLPTVSKVDQSHYYNTNLIQGLRFGQQIVFDCAFDDYMTLIEIKTTAKLLNDCIRHNRRSFRPFGLNFCNVDSKGKLLHHLKLLNPAIEIDLPVNFYNSSYLDVFRREDIVYLSPFVHKEFEYHPKDVYVLSALSNNKPLCVKKARNEGVRCFKLPLSFHEMLNKSRLRIDEAFRKLLLKKNTGECSPLKKVKQ